MGNIQQESSFRINAISYDGHNSYGICQWTDSRKTNLKNWCKEHGYKSDSVEGQVKFLEHELESYKDLNSKLKSGTDSLSSLTVLFEEKFERAKASAAHNETRIKYAKEFDARYKAFAGAKFTGMYLGDEGAYAGMGLVAHVEQMISSANYKWLSDWDEDKDSDDIAIAEILKKSADAMMNAARLLSESNAVNISELLSKLGSAIQTVEVKKKTKITGSTTTYKLSSSPTWVEAPWFGVYIGDFFIGDLTRGRSPNYIERLTVDKLNGRVNQYTITIVHQIASGDNPNFIDELIGKNGYDKIIITYGDQNIGSFRDEEAIITDVKQTFNFSSSQITYTISATSNAIAVTSAKYNYPTITEKPSDMIMDLLYGEANSDLLKAFPGMADQSKVLENKLIPDDDLEVEIESMNDVNVLMYLNSLVSAMISKTNKQVTGDLNDSVYMLSYHDADDKIPDGSYFRITKIGSGMVDLKNQLYYEVDVGYDPGDSFVYDFALDNSYGWAAAYSGGAVDPTNYNYGFENNGDLVRAGGVTNTNWWTQVTNYPLTASLTVKGLLSPLMLMTYIKINHVYYGSKRMTSGMYTVIGQTDTLGKDGFKTTLKLLRVAGDNQYLTTDARVAT